MLCSYGFQPCVDDDGGVLSSVFQIFFVMRGTARLYCDRPVRRLSKSQI